MKFLQQIVFYCLLAGTGYLSLYYIYTAVFKPADTNPYFIKQIFGIASVFVLVVLHKAYQTGEINAAYPAGIKWILISWLPYIAVTIGYVILAKIMGRL